MKRTKTIIAVVLLVVGFLGCCYIEHNYTRYNCEVVAVTETGAIFEDVCGWQWYWEFEEGEHFELGDFADLKMYDYCTSAYIDDDVIKKVVKQ